MEIEVEGPGCPDMLLKYRQWADDPLLHASYSSSERLSRWR